jgi:DNA-binding PadR family transcriptional regulator
VLGAVGEGPTHGFAVAQLLASDGPLGRVWTVARPAVYAAFHKLLRSELISAGPVTAGNRGPSRTTVTLTEEGAVVLADWLASPVDHVRDVRSLLLLKLALLDRRAIDPVPLLAAQRELLLPRITALTAQRNAAAGFERTLTQWRLESCDATLNFLQAIMSG